MNVITNEELTRYSLKVMGILPWHGMLPGLCTLDILGEPHSLAHSLGKASRDNDQVRLYRHHKMPLLFLSRSRYAWARKTCSGGDGMIDHDSVYYRFVAGITGQDGFYLSKFLLEKGYTVHGLVRPSSHTSNTDHEPPHPDVIAHYGDILDLSSLQSILFRVMPDEVYHLAAQSHVPTSLNLTSYTVDANLKGTQYLVDVVVILNKLKEIKLLNACSSEVFGLVTEVPQTEVTEFRPQSPYAITKAATFWIISNTRQIHGLFMVNAISFNHESPHRGSGFVTRKITLGVARIAHGLCEHIQLGNLDAYRDWSHSRDIIHGMYLMMQHQKAIDLVLASGKCHTVREFAETAFDTVGISICWRGNGENEVGIDAKTGTIRIRVNSEFYRPLEVPFLQGCADKAREYLNWNTQVDFKALIREMIEVDMTRVAKDLRKAHL